MRAPHREGAARGRTALSRATVCGVRASLRSLLPLAVVACVASPRGPSSPAADGVRAYVNALQADDAHAAYALLSADTRKKLSFEEFSLAWKQTAAERHWQAKALEETLRGSPDVGERAVASVGDGKLVPLEREGNTWRLESELVTRTHAKDPADAIRMFAQAIAARDVDGALKTLTQRRRDGLQRQIDGFISGLAKHADNPIDKSATRAELRWDENGIRYRIVLRKEDDEWRVDDIYIRPAPKEEDDKPEPAQPDE
jgi:hypothetical protein